MIGFDLNYLHEVINKKFYPLINDMRRYLVLYGSAGSGKSHFIAQKFLIRIIYGFEDNKVYKILALRKTQPAVRKSVFALFKIYINAWGLDSFCKINNTEMTFTFINGSQIICVGLDDREKLKSIEGITDAWMEEATEFDQKDFAQVDLRVRGKTNSFHQIAVSFNPISKLFWVHKEFFTNLHKDDATVMHSTYKDNQFIDEAYRIVLENLIKRDKVYHQIYALGEWGALENVVYNNWAIVPNGMPEAFNAEAYVVDFGFNDPSTITHIREVDNTEIYIDELLYETGLTNSKFIKRMELLKIPKDIEIFADSASPEKIQEIADAGYKILGAIKGKNSVKVGIDIVKRYNLHITKRSVNTKTEIQSYAYKKDKNENITDEPVDFNNHVMDPVRYGVRYWWVRKNEWALGDNAPKGEKREAPDRTETFKPKGVPLINMMKKQEDLRTPGNVGYRGDPF